MPEAVCREVGANHIPRPGSVVGRQPQHDVRTARRVQPAIMPTDSEHSVQVVHFVAHRRRCFQPGQRVTPGAWTPQKIGGVHGELVARVELP
jgi:hypothetical protein